MASPRFVNLDQLAKIGSLTTDIIADLAITGEKISDGSITAAKLGAEAVDASALADSGITAVKLNSDVFGAGVIPNGTTNAIDLNVDNLTLEVVSDVLRVKDSGITTSKLNIDNNLTFNQNQALEFRLENLSSDPSAGNPGRLIFRTDTQQVRVDDGSSFTSIGTGGGGGHVIQDEGTPLTQRTNLNFVGSGVTVTDDSGNDASVVTIPGGGGGTFATESFVVSNPLDKTFNLANTPISNSERISWNGLFLRPGASNDYTVAGSAVTLTAGITLTVGDEVTIGYSF